MPVQPTFPGIYIEELPSSVHTITAAPTNIAIFIGYTNPLKTNPANWGQAVQIFGFSDYQRQFGGFVRSTAFANSANSFGDMAQAVNQFFLNGGTQAYIVALQALGAQGGVSGATIQIGSLTFTALEITDENYQMSVTVRPIGPALSSPPASPPGEPTADITITYGPTPTASASGLPPGTIVETYRQVSLNPTDPNYILTRIGTPSNQVSSLVTVAVGSPPGLFPGTQQTVTSPSSASPSPLPGSTQIFNPIDFTTGTPPGPGVLAQDTSLDKVAVFNLMVIPGVTNELILSTALAFCERKFAFYIMDPPIAASADGTLPQFPLRIQDELPNLPTSKNAGLYFPYLQSPNPLTGLSTDPVSGLSYEIPPAATVAGIFASTDLSRGVWKAPAGFQATTTNTTGVAVRGRMTDQRQGVLNPLGINCLRDFPNIGTAVFGSRTMVTLTDQQWRYVPVRRMALFLEQTLYANLGWVVFEPNADPLWTAIRNSIESFMLGLFRQGAFQGTTPSQAFQVKCDSQTTTQDDVNNGIVNIVVAFAPLKPAEFVIIQIAQLAGQTQTS
jgi:uncharacterized protein